MKVIPILKEVDMNIAVSGVSRQVYQNYSDINKFEIIVILDGAMVFASDLIRKLSWGQLNCSEKFNVHTIKVNSREGMVSTGQVKEIIGFSDDFPKNSHILIIEDIIDSGLTIDRVKTYLYKDFSSKSVKVCALLSRESKHDICNKDNFIIGHYLKNNDYVVGYGLDYKGKYRGLPYIARLEF